MSPVLSIAALTIALLLPSASSPAASPGPTSTSAASTVIRTRAELGRYLKTIPLDQSPLSLLPAGARKRFLGSLGWGSTGLGTFVPDDLTQYLTNAQIHRVLAMFDLANYAAQMQGRAMPLTPAERDAPETLLEYKFDKLYFSRQNEISGDKHPTNIPTLYDRLLASYQNPLNLAKLNDSDVGLLFRAAGLVAFTSHDRRYLDDLRLDLVELSARGLATAAQVSKVYGQLVAARRFSDADAFARQYPTAGVKLLPPLKRATDLRDGSPTVLVMEPDGKSMLRKPVDMQAPLRIVVVAGCHFSEDAARAIRADPQLDKLFHEHAVWLAAESESLPDVLEWNRQFPDQPMNVAWRNGEWSMLGSWDIPTFYVFRDGKQVDRWSGWGPDGLERLKEHLRKNGLPN